ncbi:diguanylate cyclase [Achromobacter sp. UMC71]|uniref:GGDEF domain-containing protein n=1 Tax=Achromobacter sp. UMC71 TaxID=1862320 RepID=UPI0016024FFC|nr:GGDEF domain-containing protein [Achromobacter sp. UMC71]MBB1627354.1 diguanylate cyclase [Achromobacter sp. UMC71]
MLRSRFSIQSLERYFLILAAGVVLPMSVLTAILLFQSRDAYVATDDAQRAFRVVRATVNAMEKVSAERGPMNAALGADYPVAQPLLDALQAARDRSDTSIAQLLALYRAPLSPDSAKEFTNIQRIRYALIQARAEADRLIALPREAVSGYAVLTAVNGMVALVPELQAAMAESVGVVMQNEADAPSLLTLALLASDLREQAGLLGSIFTPALAKRRQLTDADEYRIERVLGRIDQLRALLEARIATRPKLRASLMYMDLQRLYFGEGMHYLEAVRDRAALQPGGADISTAELARNYVPLMASITQFRDLMLDSIEEGMRQRRDDAIRLLVITLVAATMLAAALMLSLGQFRRRVIRPFVQATRIIGAIADGKAMSTIPVGQYRGEVDGMFKALRVLEDNASARKQLERERDRLIVDLAVMAETDFLTGLLNRRAFEHRFEQALTQWSGSEEVLAFILFDIDDFKGINDTYGHASGDQALKTVADLCRQTWRQSDVVARVGGEEFAVLCRTRTAEQAVAAAERMRVCIARARVPAENGAVFALTASFGVAYASWRNTGAADTLFRQADELLYQAKMSGKDRVVSSDVG